MTEYHKYKLKKFLREYKIMLTAICLTIAFIFLLLLTRHRHEYGKWEPFMEPTCSSQGYERRFCSCGSVDTKILDYADHTEGEWRISEDGTKRELLCSVCRKVIRTETDPEHIHDWSEWTLTESPACKVSGKEVCSCSCGLTQERKVAALEHEFSDWITEAENGCEVVGSKIRYCSRCGSTESEEIPALGHVKSPPRIVGTEILYYCERCSELLECEQITASSGLEIENGVVFGLGTCTDTTVVIPSEHGGVAVTEIGDRAFKGEGGIVSVILPQSVKVIGDSAFFGCNSLVSVDLEFIQEIGSDAFAYCEKLESIRLGTSLSRIGRWVFEYSASLSDIYYEGSSEDWVNIEKRDDWNKYAPEYRIIYGK